MMSDKHRQEQSFIGYEYKSLIVQMNMESLWRDGYNAFGWKLDKSVPAIKKHLWGPLRILVAPLAIFPGSPFAKMILDHPLETKAELKFKRDRAIRKKAELSQLQSQFEASAVQIENLEISKKSIPTVAASITGLVGTVFMAASVFAYLTGMLQLSILIAIPGFAGWILSYFVYQAVKGSRTRKLAPFIEKEYDTIHETCKKANTFIHS
jgi:hypothetical protein